MLLLEVETDPQQTKELRVQSYNCKDLNSDGNLSDPGSGFSPT